MCGGDARVPVWGGGLEPRVSPGPCRRGRGSQLLLALRPALGPVGDAMFFHSMVALYTKPASLPTPPAGSVHEHCTQRLRSSRAPMLGPPPDFANTGQAASFWPTYV